MERFTVFRCAVGVAMSLAWGNGLRGAAEDVPPKEGPSLEVVAEFPDQQVTGVAVSRSGRIFVNFPYWSDPHTLSVAEIDRAGQPRAFPDEAWNRTTGEPGRRFVCVQSVYVDEHDTLWILDAAAPKMEGVIQGGAKLLQVDLSRNEIVRVYSFDDRVVRQTSYLNDVRVDRDRQRAFITDSGEGALIVLNLESGATRRLLEGHASVKPEAEVVLTVEGRRLADQKKGGQPPAIAADSIALDRAEGFLYFKPLTGYSLYRVWVTDLADEALTDSDLSERVERVADAPASDGFVFREDQIFVTAIEENAIIAYDTEENEAQTIVTDPKLKWPDSLAFGPDGALYITTSQIHLTPRFNEGRDEVREPYRVLRLPNALDVTAARTAE
ncbi:MAG TPA: L-dopachrome tautomerase-related protein [Candidatus Synoicihabitans sp.]|nr:L-dopachrome tautomerase-related protein [Candidatus Synoicihabitans sp.]